MRQMLVIGAGYFGRNLAVKLVELKNEVMLVDNSEAAVSQVESRVTAVKIGDCMDRGVLEELGVRNFDICFVCISENFQSSMEITSLLKEMGARYVVAKSDRDIQAELLRKIGADDVIYPERDMARRTAVRYSARGTFDYFELSPEYAVMEIAAPSAWIGHGVRELDVRSNHGVNVIGVRSDGHVIPIISSDHIFMKGEHIIVAGFQADITKLVQNR